MTPYERGYAAGLKAAAETCKTMADVFSTAERYSGLSGAATACKEAILSLPLQGEAEGSGPCVVVPVEPTEKMLEALWGRKFEQSHTGSKRIAREKYKALLAAALEEHDARR